METLKINEVLETCLDYVYHLGKEDSKQFEEAFEQLKHKIVIKDYLPLELKQNCLERCLKDLMTEGDQVYDYSVAYEISLLFNCLFAYTNIDLNINTLFKESNFYDAVYVSGLADYILDCCAKDYNRLVHMVDNMISFDNINQLERICSVATPDTIGKLVAEFKDFKNDFNPESIKNLRELLDFNDPTLANLQSTIEKAAAKAAKEK